MGAILVSAVISGSIYALISLGFAIAFRVSGVFNFTHGVLLVAAAYLNYGLINFLNFPTWLAVPGAIISIGFLGLLIEAWLIPAAKNVGLKSVDLLVLSWLVLLIIQNLLSLVFSNASIYLGGSAVTPIMTIGGMGITPLHLTIVGVSSILGVILFLLIRYSYSGWEVLAVGDNARLATICGVDVRRVIKINACAASVLTASAGVLLSYQERLDPSLGMRFSVIGIVSTLIGFHLGPAGAVLGGLILAVLEALVLYLIDPALRNLAVYGCLFAVVLFTYRRTLVPAN